MSLSLRITRVPIQTLSAFMEAVAVHSTSDAEELADFAGFSPKTASRALPSLETLGVVERNSAGVYRIKTEGVTRGMSSDAAALILRREDVIARAASLCEPTIRSATRYAHLHTCRRRRQSSALASPNPPSMAAGFGNPGHSRCIFHCRPSMHQLAALGLGRQAGHRPARVCALADFLADFLVLCHV